MGEFSEKIINLILSFYSNFISEAEKTSFETTPLIENSAYKKEHGYPAFQDEQKVFFKRVLEKSRQSYLEESDKKQVKQRLNIEDRRHDC